MSQSSTEKIAWIVRSSSNDPWFNLALEEFLMRKLQTSLATKGQLGAILYLWQNQNTVVIGRNQNAWAECKTALLEEEGGKLARRTTGGGAVFHDLGNLNFSLLLPEIDFDLDRNFQWLVDTVRREGILAERSGRNDVLAEGRKFSGNAFRIEKKVGLHHGTLLVHSHFERIGRYLTVSPEKLKAKGVSSVRSRVTNLQSFCPDISVALLESAMEKAFVADFCSEENVWQIVRHDEDSFAHDPELIPLVHQFSSWEWRYGETISFDWQEERKFSWGQVSLGLGVSQGRVERISVYSDALDSDYISGIASSLKGLPFTSAALAQGLRANIPLGSGFGVSRREMASELANWIEEQGW